MSGLQDTAGRPAPLRTLAHRLAERGDVLSVEAAAEIMRLRGVVRVNAVRHGATHGEVDAVLYPAPVEVVSR